MIHYVYVAGPYSIGDVALNVRAAIQAAEEVAALGLFPYVPHLNHLWHLASPHPRDFWLDLDLAWLLRCDALLLLPGESEGAQAEARFAEAHGIPVFCSLADLAEVSR